MFAAACTYVVWILATMFFLPASLVLAAISGELRRDNHIYFHLTSWWSYFLIKASFLRIAIEGVEHLPIYPEAPAIIIMNHTSALDIPLLEMLLGGYPRIWLSKQEYGSVPLFGYLVRKMHVLVDRASARHAAQALLRARKLVHEKSRHLVMFPEGTRSQTGELQDFLSGFVVLARSLQRPVIVVQAKGLFNVFSKKSWFVNCMQAVTVKIYPPFMQGTEETDEEFLARVRKVFSEKAC